MLHKQSYLRTALANIHHDPQWWRTVMIGGGCMLSLFGWPLASGLVIESFDNSHKGYPTPLPMWYDLGTRYLIGLFALLIDFVLFVLPLFFVAGLLVCGLLATLVAGVDEGAGGGFALAAKWLLALVGLAELALFACSAAPVARLIYVGEGRIEDALGAAGLWAALAVPARRVYLRARLLSLPAYLPAALLALITWAAGYAVFPGQALVLIVLAWLTLSGLLYGHLAVAQIYVLAEKDVQRMVMLARMP